MWHDAGMAIEPPASSRIAGIARGLVHLLRLMLDTYPRGFAVIRLVPGFLLVAAIPEFVQHIAEIRMGMFVSIANAKALSNSALRWDFGYFKLAGLALALILVARFWAKGRSWRAALLIPPRVLGHALIAVGVIVGLGLLLAPERLALPMPLDVTRTILSSLIQTGLFAWAVGIVLEDRTLTLRNVFTERFPSAIVITILFAVGMLPLQVVHGLDHRFALGRPEAIVWALMTWDALLVGVMAMLGGSGIYLGYASGLTWRGWRPIAGLQR